MAKPTAPSPPRWAEYQPISALRPATRNAKAHDQAALASSVTAFGFVEPVVLDERTGRLLAGHGRTEYLAALKAEGGEPPEGVTVAGDEWQVLVVRGVSSTDDAHADAMGVALNRVGERGGWDKPVLADVLADLVAASLLDVAGFDQGALDDLIALTQEAAEEVRFDPDGEAGSAAHGESTYDEWGQNYRNKQVRSMVFDYPLDEYRAVTELAARARPALGVESNAELFAVLLRRWAEANPEAPA